MAEEAAAELPIGRLRAEGRRITGARRALARALAAAGGHVTAEELVARLQVDHPDMAPSTIYRQLADLEQLGLVVRVHLGHGPAVYHLADAAHVHLVCDGCGSITELPLPMVNTMARQLRARFGFEADFHHFSIGGTCRSCVASASRSSRELGQHRVSTRSGSQGRPGMTARRS